MKCPEWATAMIRNYRDRYEAVYGVACSLTDDEIFTITKEIGVLSTHEEQDEATVEDMHTLQNKKEVPNA